MDTLLQKRDWLLGYIKPKAVIMTMWRRGFLKHLEKGSGDVPWPFSLLENRLFRFGGE